MRITLWFRTLGNRIRSFFAQLGAIVSGWWQGAWTRVTSPFRRAENSESVAPAPWRVRLQQIGAAIRGAFGSIGQWINRVWQMVSSFLGRVLRGTITQPGLTIRKTGVNRSYEYNRDQSEMRQLLTDSANILAIVMGIGAWPYLRQWAIQNLSPLFAPHVWVVAMLVSILPLIIVYQRWQHTRQQRNGVDWDILTLATAFIGFFGVLVAGFRLLATFTPVPFQWASLVCAMIAVVAWLWGETVNLYTLLIRRPYSVSMLLSLSKSLLFLLSGWLILIYVPLVILFAGTIQLESATFLLIIFVAAALLGFLVAAVRYGLNRFRIRLPRFAST